jgi:long-chain fatty acid transport protein
MKKILLQFCFSLITIAAFGQAGHVMQGVGAVNMSMGGAATGQPLDISGALQWNPAAISTFDNTIIKLDIGLFFSSPELSSSLPPDMLGPGAPGVSGTTLDDRGTSLMPALGIVWGKEGSKHTFGASAFGISGFGVTFPEEANAPVDSQGNPNPNFNPSQNSNPINYPQAARGFGHIESDYMLLQIGFTYAYEISEKFSIGIEPTFNYGTLQLMPNPTSSPSQTLGYPTTDKASTTGFGGQIGLFYNSGNGFKAGASYKTEQFMSELDFQNTYLNGDPAQNNLFTMNYPAIISVGVGYSMDKFDFAVDYRNVDYKNTDGFAESGWAIASNGFPTGAVSGFGWENMTIISAGIQFKGIEKLPIRVGYTYSSNPITEELAFFSVSAPAVVNNAFQLGLSFIASDRFSIDAMFHHGTSGETTGLMLNPMAITPSNPLGSMPGTSVSYKMSTDLIMVGASYVFNKSSE